MKCSCYVSEWLPVIVLYCREVIVNDCVSETHHHHLLGSQRLSTVPRMWTGAVCGACGAQGGQPPASMPAGHRKRLARGERCGEAEHALAALLLCHHRFHTHHQGAFISRSNSVQAAFLPTLLHCDNAKKNCWLFSLQRQAVLQPFPFFVLAPNPWPQQHPWLCQLSHSWEREAPLHYEASRGQPWGRRTLLHSLPRIFRRAGTHSQRTTHQ